MSAVATCPKWCTDHETYPDCDWHSTAMARIIGADINMASHHETGEIGIFGVESAPDQLTISQAETLAFYLLGLVQAARA